MSTVQEIRNGSLLILLKEKIVIESGVSLDISGPELDILIILNRQLGERFTIAKLVDEVGIGMSRSKNPTTVAYTYLYNLRKKLGREKNYIVSYPNFYGVRASTPDERTRINQEIDTPDRFSGLERVIGCMHINFLKTIFQVRGRSIDIPISQFRLLAELASYSPWVVPRKMLKKVVDEQGMMTDIGLKQRIEKLKDNLGDGALIRTVKGIGYELEENNSLGKRPFFSQLYF